MIDLTPLDVRNKRSDFKKILRGYDPQEVDVFLELVAERLEEVVREAVHLRDQVATLQQIVDSHSGREHAVHEALVTAQELRKDIKGAARREADLIIAEARAEGRRALAEADAQIRSRLGDAERRLEVGRDTMEEIERRRTRFLKSFRQLLERELEEVEVEEGREPVGQRPIGLDLGRPEGGAAEAEPGDRHTGEPFAGVDPLPPPDAPVDALADGYKAEAEGLFTEELTNAGGKREDDLFSLPKDNAEEDTRWG